jgi:hypothetical protein
LQGHKFDSIRQTLRSTHAHRDALRSGPEVLAYARLSIDGRGARHQEPGSQRRKQHGAEGNAYDGYAAEAAGLG